MCQPRYVGLLLLLGSTGRTLNGCAASRPRVCAMSALPPPPPSTGAPGSGLLVGGSPAQIAMRAQAVLPTFPSLSPTASVSSACPPSPSSSPPLSATVSDLPLTHVHLAASSPSLSARRDVASSSLSLTAPPLPPPAVVDGGLSSSECAAGSKAHKAAICALLEALQTTMFTRKKEALDAYQSYVASQHPRFTRSDALLLLYGSPVTPNSTLSAFPSTAAFTRTDRGLLAASGQLSWKNHQLRASASKALGVLAVLLDSRHNADAGVFHQLIVESDYSVIRLMKLPKHLSAPSPASSAQGNLHAALRVIDIVRELRPDLIDALLEEKDAAANTHSSNSRLPAHHNNGAAPRSSPPTLQLHINIQSNSAVGSPRSGQAAEPTPLSPLSPNSPPPLPTNLSEALAMTALHNSAPHRPPPPLPAFVGASQLHQPLPPPALSGAAPLTVNACQSPHSAAATYSPWLSAFDGSGTNTTGPTASTPTSGNRFDAITQPLSACTSPITGKKKHFSSLPSGLQRLNAPPAHQSSTSHSGGGGGTVADDWKQRLRSHLSGFFAHRISREELERSGVLKRSQLFGVPLATLSAADDADPRLGHSTTASTLSRCVECARRSHYARPVPNQRRQPSD